MKKHILVVIILLSSLVSISQNLVHTSYSWDQNPTYSIAQEDKDLDMVGLKDYRIVEFGFENENEFYQYDIIHKVQELDDSKIFTATDETTNRTIKYYALEGIEKGGFIEYLYIIKKVAKYKGQYLRLQDNYKIKDAKFELYAPENLVFKIYPINSDQEASEDTEVEGKQHLIVQKYDLPELDAEELS